MSELNPVQNNPHKENGSSTIADAMKDIRKKKLQREVYADSSRAAELVRIKASPVYNAKGEVIQATSTGHGKA